MDSGVDEFRVLTAGQDIYAMSDSFRLETPSTH
jgi:hypothetical protein